MNKRFVIFWKVPRKRKTSWDSAIWKHTNVCVSGSRKLGSLEPRKKILLGAYIPLCTSVSRGEILNTDKLAGRESSCAGKGARIKTGSGHLVSSRDPASQAYQLTSLYTLQYTIFFIYIFFYLHPEIHNIYDKK